MLVRNVKLNDDDVPRPQHADHAEGQPDHGVQGAAGDARPHSVQRALGQGRHVERLWQVRLGSGQGAQPQRRARADHERVQDVQGQGAQGGEARPVRRRDRPRRRDQDREGGEEGREEGPLVREAVRPRVQQRGPTGPRCRSRCPLAGVLSPCGTPHLAGRAGRDVCAPRRADGVARRRAARAHRARRPRRRARRRSSATARAAS